MSLLASLLAPGGAAAQACDDYQPPTDEADRRARLVADPSTVTLLEACGEVRAWQVAHPDRFDLIPRPSWARDIVTECWCGRAPLSAAALGVPRDARARLFSTWRGELHAAAARVARGEQLCATLHERLRDRDGRVMPRSELRIENAINEAATALARLQSEEHLCREGRVHDRTLPSERDLDRLDAFLRSESGGATRTDRFQEALGEVRREAAERGGAESTVHRNLAAGGAGAASVAAGTEIQAMLTTALEGLARLLVRRAALEVQTFIIDRIRDDVCTPDAREGARQDREAADAARQDGGDPSDDRRIDPEAVSAALLANTCGLLGSDTFAFSADFGASFEAAILADLLSAPRAVLALLAQHVQGAGGEGVRAARLALELAVALMDASDPADVLARLADEVEGWGSDAARLSTALRVGATVAELAVRAPDGSTATEGAPVSDSTVAALFELGLGDSLTVGQERAALALTRHTHELIDLLRANTAEEPPSGGGEREAAVAGDGGGEGDAGAGGRGGAAEQPHEAPRGEIDVASVIATTVSMVDDVILLARASGASQLPEGVPGWLSAALDDLLSGQPGLMMRGGLTILREGLRAAGVAVPDGAIRVLALGAELASSGGDAEAAARALDQFAAPVGSWRAKQQRMVVSLTGLLGLWGGAEYALRTPVTTDSGGGGLGVVGLVGLDLTWPIERTASLGLFLSVVDVGAFVVASGASPQPTSDNEPDSVGTEVSPLQFLSPGVYFRAGLPDIPIVLGVGASILPWGRTVEWTEMNETHSELVPVLRLQAFAAVDVTIWPF